MLSSLRRVDMNLLRMASSKGIKGIEFVSFHELQRGCISKTHTEPQVCLLETSRFNASSLLRHEERPRESNEIHELKIKLRRCDCSHLKLATPAVVSMLTRHHRTSSQLFVSSSSHHRRHQQFKEASVSSLIQFQLIELTL